MLLAHGALGYNANRWPYELRGLERLPPEQKAVGSNPTWGTIERKTVRTSHGPGGFSYTDAT